MSELKSLLYPGCSLWRVANAEHNNLITLKGSKELLCDNNNAAAYSPVLWFYSNADLVIILPPSPKDLLLCVCTNSLDCCEV